MRRFGRIFVVNATKFSLAESISIAFEKEYMKCFLSGEYKPKLLFDDYEILENIKNHPMPEWKYRDKF